MTTTASSPCVSEFLSAPLVVGEPDVVGPLAVFPLFGPVPRFEYRSFAEASSFSSGASVTELPGRASVNDVLVQNPTDMGVLLYEGEELLGAQQNRTVDHAVLVAAGSSLKVPVSCVEHGRWDRSRHGEAFAPSPQTAYPGLRAAKNLRMRQAMAAGAEIRANQGEVWEGVAGRLGEAGAESRTDAMHDAYEARRGQIDSMRSGIERRDGQVGALVAISGEWVVMDVVSRADVFAALHGPLVSGYALDALGVADGVAPVREHAALFVASVCGAAPRIRPAVGLGRALAFETGAASGTGLVHDGELIQLSAYVSNGDDSASGRGARAAGIRRPSRRRAA